MVTATHPLTLAQLWAVAALRGVRNTLALASGPVDVGRVDAIAEEPHPPAGVDAGDDRVERAALQHVAGAAVAASFDAGENVPLPLGSSAFLRGPNRAPVRTRVGTYASSGLPGIDLAVNPQLGRQLGVWPPRWCSSMVRQLT